MSESLQCKRCHTLKNPDEFSLDKTRETGRYPYCKLCVHEMHDNDVYREQLRANYRRRMETDPKFRADAIHHAQVARFKSLYGITEEEYNILLEFQEGKCAICGNPPRTRRLSVDHDHKTGEVRGLLCMRCNQTLHERVTMEWLIDAYEYLDVPPVFDALGRIPVGKKGRIRKRHRIQSPSEDMNQSSRNKPARTSQRKSNHQPNKLTKN